MVLVTNLLNVSSKLSTFQVELRETTLNHLHLCIFDEDCYM